ncbi:MAG: DUF1853 family protein [Akkermansiaceae bacterium]
MDHYPNTISKALFKSLIQAPPLLNDLPEANTFPCRTLATPKDQQALNFQQKLGHLYEDALAVMLESTPQYDPLAKGVQIREEAGRTLGELDFLVKDLVSDNLIHLELAVKFYLSIEAENGFLLPGPDARDNYFRKLEKMRSHQLVLVENNRHLLPENFRASEIIVQQLVHGCIFNHVTADNLVEAEFLNPKGRRGKWLHANECTDHFDKNTFFEIIPKPLWPVPLELMENIELERWNLTEDTARCVMVRVDNLPIPYFIAPNNYPLLSSN